MALYTKCGNEIQIEKASGHGLGFLFAPKETKKGKQADEEDTPEWVMEAWEFLLRERLGLASNEPPWVGLPAMMRMVLNAKRSEKQKTGMVRTV